MPFWCVRLRLIGYEDLHGLFLEVKEAKRTLMARGLTILAEQSMYSSSLRGYVIASAKLGCLVSLILGDVSAILEFSGNEVSF